jgi:CheY-like chemotaxis protein
MPSLLDSVLTKPIELSGGYLKNMRHAPAESENGGASTPKRTPPHILVVDDESVIADTIVQILNRSGFVAHAAYSGQQAIEAARQHCPELVLSDVMMPAIDGVETAIAIRELCPDARIVLFSGQATTIEILARAEKRGHTFELLPKPIHPTQLIKHLRES